MIMPENDALLLPEPFSEKNIDGSPISRSDEGRSLFRNPGRKDRRVGERRGTDRRSGVERRAPEDDYGFVPPREESVQYDRSAAPEPVQYDRPAAPEPARYERPSAPEPVRYDRPVTPEPSRYDSSSSADFSDYGQRQNTRPVSYEERAETIYEPAPRMESAADRPSSESGSTETSYDTDRFEPPVDEKPGMIPNPLKMPPVKKKSSLEYDVESDYGGYGDEKGSASSSDDDGYGYDFADDSSNRASSDDGYGYDYDDERTGISGGAGAEEGKSSFGGSDDSDQSFGSDEGGYDDYGSGDYGSGEYGSDYDSDYGSDYESGSDISSDYY